MSGNGTRIELADDWSENGWFSFPRKFIRDRDLSWKAKGIAALLASHSSTFKFSASELERWAKDGRDGTAAGVRELEAAGYLVRERQSTGEMVYRLFPEPQPENPEQAGQKPHTENPPTEIPGTEKPGDYKKTTPKETTPVGDTQVDISATSDALFDVDAPPEPAGEPVDYPTFVEFWAVYPLRKAKQAAQKAWDRAMYRVPKVDRPDRARAIVKGAQQYRDDPNRDPKFTKHPATWLNGGCWEDEAAPVGAGHSRGGYQQYRDEDYYPEAKPWFDPDDLKD